MMGIQRHDNAERLEIRGDMTVAEVPGLLRAISHSDHILHVDMAAVGRVDSSALTVLLACSRSAHGATVTVHHAPPALRALSDLYGLQTLFRIV
jgi:ABC-type transporter Mla MlaB component